MQGVDNEALLSYMVGYSPTMREISIVALQGKP